MPLSDTSPTEDVPRDTALNAYCTWIKFPSGENIVSEESYGIRGLWSANISNAALLVSSILLTDVSPHHYSMERTSAIPMQSQQSPKYFSHTNLNDAFAQKA